MHQHTTLKVRRSFLHHLLFSRFGARPFALPITDTPFSWLLNVPTAMRYAGLFQLPRRNLLGDSALLIRHDATHAWKRSLWSSAHPIQESKQRSTDSVASTRTLKTIVEKTLVRPQLLFNHRGTPLPRAHLSLFSAPLFCPSLNANWHLRPSSIDLWDERSQTCLRCPRLAGSGPPLGRCFYLSGIDCRNGILLVSLPLLHRH